MVESERLADAMPSARPKSPFRILSLDGGGAKGFYSLGVLHEIEAMAGAPLCEEFDLVFGTSTGSIIGALIALGCSVEQVHSLYKKHVTPILAARGRRGKTRALNAAASKVFGTADFSAFRTDVGVVATSWEMERPLIFKSSVGQAHGRRGSFVPGFGCRIADAVQASCSAYPFFSRKRIKAAALGDIELVDGGFCANNPTLFAIADATAALGIAAGDVRVLSVGVGAYPTPRPRPFGKMWFANRLTTVELLQKTLEANSRAMEQLTEILFGNSAIVRVNDTFSEPHMATDMFETNPRKLTMLYQRGRESFGAHEKAIADLLRA